MTPDEVAAILEDPAYGVPPAAPGPFGTLAWLRSTVPAARARTTRLVDAVGPGAVAADLCILVQAARALPLDLTGLPFGAGRRRCPGERRVRA
jgi:hypothetical protein